jgi:hypothetical protein
MGEFFSLADVDGDGALDVVLGSNDVELFFGDGAGGFAPAITVPVGSLSALAVGDVTGDGLADLVIGDDFAGLVVRVNAGGRAFAAPVATQVGGAVADLVLPRRAASGARDVAAIVGGGGLVVLANDGAGALVEVARRAMPGWWWPRRAVGAGDLQADGIDEVVTLDDDGIDVFARAANGALEPTARVSTVDAFGAPAGYLRPAFGDLTGDGRMDVIVADGFAGIMTLVGDGSGALRPALRDVYRPSYGAAYDFALGDFGGDGFADLLGVDSSLYLFRTRSPYAPPD